MGTMGKSELHNNFLKRLDALLIKREFSYKEESYSFNCPFGNLSYTAQKKYLNKYCNISENNYDNWKKKSNTTVPDADTLYRIAEEFHSSIDFLLGLTDIKGTQKENEIKEYTGLELDAIRQLHAWKEESLKDGLLSAQFMQSLKTLNVILCDKYSQEQKGYNGWDVLHFIGSYLISDKIVRERGYARYQSGDRYERLEKGDIVIKANTKEEMQVDVPIVTYEITGDVKKVGVYEEDNPNNRYYVELAKLYKAMSLRSIGEVLDNVIKRQKEQTD